MSWTPKRLMKFTGEETEQLKAWLEHEAKGLYVALCMLHTHARVGEGAEGRRRTRDPACGLPVSSHTCTRSPPFLSSFQLCGLSLYIANGVGRVRSLPPLPCPLASTHDPSGTHAVRPLPRHVLPAAQLHRTSSEHERESCGSV